MASDTPDAQRGSSFIKNISCDVTRWILAGKVIPLRLEEVLAIEIGVAGMKAWIHSPVLGWHFSFFCESCASENDIADKYFFLSLSGVMMKLLGL